MSRSHFRKVAANGFGDGANSYPYCAAWYDDHLYIGTTRHALCVLKMRLGLEVPFETWPVPIPDSDHVLDLRAQIWRYSPRDRAWERVFRSPMTRGLGERQVPLSLGFRNMAVFQGRSDPRPVIYTISSCGSFGQGPILFRCDDGREFRPASEPGLSLGDPSITTFRGVVPFKGRLFITPAGSRGGNPSTSFNAVVLCTDDPRRGAWQPSNVPSFGEPTNYGIFDIGTCGRYLYAGTTNIREGSQLWRTDGEGPPPHRWTKVFDRGADRGPFNQLIMSFASLRGVLYLGTGIQNGGNDRLNNIGPAAGEVIRVYPDGSWDLVVGEPRLTRQGFKVPTSGLGPGFDNPMTGYMWRMAAHEGHLYVGTFDAHTFLRFSDRSNWAEWSRKLNDPETFDRYLARRSGCELWRTYDGDHWSPVTRNGFENPFNYGFRTVYSTPVGLFAGTANPFGPQVAVRGPSGWRYEDNPRGGLEIWHGSPDHVGEDAVTPAFRVAAALGASDPIEPSTLPETPDATEGPDADPPAHHGTPGFDDEILDWIERDPLGRTYGMPQDLVGLTEDVAEEINTYFSGGLLRNVGFWAEGTTTPREAAGRLLQELFAFLPADPRTGRPLSVIAVGVGMDDPVHGVARLRPGDSVTLASPPDVVPPPGPRGGLLSLFRRPRSAADPLPGASFDLVIWVEGPRSLGLAASLSRVYHLLRPGGRLLAAEAVAVAPGEERFPDAADEKTYVREYFDALNAAGFVRPSVVDVTGKTWVPFQRHSRKFFGLKLRMRQLDRDQLARVFAALPCGSSKAVEAYVLVTAAKP